MKSYLAYIRVSTVKQGEHGSSLTEQRSAIEAYALRHNLTITAWFEEMETAAKQGRMMFSKMLGELRKGRADGVIIHKIDRSARNLKDWALIGDLIDQGVDVHFAHESLDLTSRGGRLAADIQAVVASDYIRNLRDEVKKGFYGRLKQGFYPLPAPRGYLDQGKAKAKAIDPIEGPLVRRAFELYASGTYSLDTLRVEMHRLGLRTKAGEPLSFHGMANILHNPFHIGLIRIGRTNEIFEGVHEPLVSKALFERVQAVMKGRVFARPQAHDFVFQRFVRCRGCTTRTLTGESQKGHIYYRCHGPRCRGTSLASTRIDAFVRQELALLEFDEGEVRDFRDLVQTLIEEERAGDSDRSRHVNRDLALIDDRLKRLTDAFLDDSIDKVAYTERRTSLLLERQGLREVQAGAHQKPFWESVLEKFELGSVALQSYILAIDAEKGQLLKSIGSNLTARGKHLIFSMEFPFDAMRNWRLSGYGEPHHRHLRKDGGPCARCMTRGPRVQGIKALVNALSEHAADMKRSNAATEQ